MATLFTDLFDVFLDTETNSLYLSKYTPPQLSKYLNNLLRRSRQEFYSLAYPNNGNPIHKMSDVENYSSNDYSYTSSGATLTQTLNPIPISGSSFYILADGNETSNYTYNSGTGQIIVTGLPITPVLVEIFAYKNGQFNQTLDMSEEGILLDWMGVIFMKDKIKEQKLYNISIYGREDGMHSQAQHLKSLESIYRGDRKNIETKSLEYTYRNNPDNLSRFGGRSGGASS